MNKPNISVVLPLHNEEANLRDLFKRIKEALQAFGRDFEVVFIDDGSTDKSVQVLEEIFKKNDNVVVMHLFKKSGKAIALERAFEIAKGEYIVTMDSDLQYDPEDIPMLIRKVEEGYAVVSGKRIEREDSKEKIVTSKLFNVLMRALTGLAFVDYFSGLKCFRLDVIKFLSIYGDLYRFAVVFAFREGFKVAEIPVAHHYRAGGFSKYNVFNRVQRGFADLATVLFTMTFSRKRMYYLGMTGLFGMGCGTFLLFVEFSQYGTDMFGMDNFVTYAGVMLIFIGSMVQILKAVTDSFYDRHQEQRQFRRRNIKETLIHGENV